MTTTLADVSAEEVAPTWDRVLRARVWRACDLRDAGEDEEFRAACAEIVREWMLWPLTRPLLALARDEAERLLEERTAIVEAAPWLVHDYFDLETEMAA